VKTVTTARINAAFQKCNGGEERKERSSVWQSGSRSEQSKVELDVLEREGKKREDEDEVEVEEMRRR